MGREEGSGWGTHVYLWLIHFDIWQNEYNFVKFKKKKRVDGEFSFIHFEDMQKLTISGSDTRGGGLCLRQRFESHLDIGSS